MADMNRTTSAASQEIHSYTTGAMDNATKDPPAWAIALYALLGVVLLVVLIAIVIFAVQYRKRRKEIPVYIVQQSAKAKYGTPMIYTSSNTIPISTPKNNSPHAIATEVAPGQLPYLPNNRLATDIRMKSSKELPEIKGPIFGADGKPIQSHFDASKLHSVSTSKAMKEKPSKSEKPSTTDKTDRMETVQRFFLPKRKKKDPTGQSSASASLTDDESRTTTKTIEKTTKHKPRRKSPKKDGSESSGSSRRNMDDGATKRGRQTRGSIGSISDSSEPSGRIPDKKGPSKSSPKKKTKTKKKNKGEK